MMDIRELRRRLGAGKPISQEELAKRCGVSQSVISRMETGEAAFEGPVAILLSQMAESVNASEAA